MDQTARSKSLRSLNSPEYVNVPTTELPRSQSVADMADKKLNLGQRRKCGKACFGATMGIAFLLIAATVSFVLYWFYFRTDNWKSFEFVGNIGLNINTLSGVLYSKMESEELHVIRLGKLDKGSLVLSKTCTAATSELVNKSLPSLCLMYGMDAGKVPEYRLLIQNTFSDPDGFECLDIRWDIPSKGSVTDCLFIGESTRFYGAFIGGYQTWPADLKEFKSETISPNFSDSHGVRGLAAPYFLFSSGISIYFDKGQVPVVDWNPERKAGKTEEFCLSSPLQDGYLISDISRHTFGYHICLGRNMTHAHQRNIKRVFGGTTNIHLEESIIQRPIWNTLAYGVDEFHNLDQESIQTLVTQLLQHDLPASQILIDPRWEQKSGDAVFDLERFPNPTALFGWMKGGPAKVDPVLMFHPFIAKDSAAFASLVSNGLVQDLVVKGPEGNLKASWWMGTAEAMLDFRNPRTIRYMDSKIKSVLEASQLSGYRFLTGSSGWLQHPGVNSLRKQQDLLRAFEERITESSKGNVQLEISTKLSKSIVYIPSEPFGWKESELLEDYFEHQIHSIIPKALAASLAGHTVFIAPPVGGNPFVDQTGKLDFDHAETRYPSAKVFLRWLGIVLFMPSIEFVLPPWVFVDDPIVLETTKRLLQLRGSHLEYILSEARESWKHDSPLIRPLWWKYPRDKATWNCSDQFFVGNSLMVAPIVSSEDNNRRTIYIPEGKFVSAASEVINGPKWIDVEADLHQVPYFFIR